MKNTKKNDKNESYWLNFYNPIKNFENILLLPILYVLIVPGIVGFIVAKGFQKIYSIVWIAYLLYLIIYDLIYKIKKRKLNNHEEEVDDSKLKKSYFTMVNIIRILAILIINIVLVQLFMKCTEPLSKLVISIFCTCALSSLGHAISIMFNNYTAISIFKKIYVAIFLLYWIGFLIFATISFINEKLYSMILFTIPFWLFGFYFIYKEFIKKK